MRKFILLIFIVIFALFTGCTKSPGGSTSYVDNKPAISNSASDNSETDSTKESPKIDTQLRALHKEIEKSGYHAGIAFIGYVDYEDKTDDLRKFIKNSEYAKKYAFLCDTPIIDVGGAELYAVVTTKKYSTATVYPADMNENGTYNVDKDNPLYKGNGMECFLLRCNVSEIHSNVSIMFDIDGVQFSINPMISGKDGRIDNSSCYDFSIYPEYKEVQDDNYTDETNYSEENSYLEDEGVQDDVINSYNYLLQNAEIKSYINKGMVLQYTGETEVINGLKCKVFVLGTDHEDYFVRELYYGVYDNVIYSYDVLNDTWNKL